MSTKRVEGILYLSIIAVFSIGQSIGAVDGAIAKIAEAFAIPQSLAMYCSTVGALVSVAASLAVGVFAGKRIGYRPVAIISGFLLVGGGVLPFIATDFVTVCLCRAVFGLGLGGMLAVQNPILVSLVHDEQARARVLGLGTFSAFAFNCVEDVVGGALADVGWNFAFLTYAILALPYLVYVVTLPSIPVVQETESAERKPFPKIVFGLFIMVFLCGISITPLLVGCSFLSSNIIDSGFVAGIAALAFSIGCMLGGLLFPRVYHLVGRRCMTVFCVIAAAGLLGCALTRNIFALMVFLTISGCGFSAVQASAMMLVGLLCDARSVSLASGIVMAALNLGSFLCTNWMDLVGHITGEPLYNTVIIGAITYMFFAVFLWVKPAFPAMTVPAEEA